MSQIYFTSDTHYGHANIAGKNTSKWTGGGYRHYKSVKEMNEDLVRNINKYVGQEDHLYHLGDWSFGGADNIWSFRKQLVCDNIHLILGNHDHHIEENKMLDIPEEDREMCFLRFGTYAGMQARDLFSSVGHYKEILVGKTPFILSHYGHRVWHGSHKGWIHLYGHSHDSLPPYGKSMDVGIDTAIRMFGEARPFSIQDITGFMEHQPLQFPDHHDLKTNTGKPQGAKQRR